jgi:hypothetical protein
MAPVGAAAPKSGSTNRRPAGGSSSHELNCSLALRGRMERSSPREYGTHSPPKANQALSHRREYQLVSIISQSASVRGQGTRAASRISTASRSSNMVSRGHVMVRVVEARGPVEHGLFTPVLLPSLNTTPGHSPR